MAQSVPACNSRGAGSPGPLRTSQSGSVTSASRGSQSGGTGGLASLSERFHPLVFGADCVPGFVGAPLKDSMLVCNLRRHLQATEHPSVEHVGAAGALGTRVRPFRVVFAVIRVLSHLVSSGLGVARARTA